MCEICGKTPCPCQCPNSEDEIIGYCEQCDYAITDEIAYYTDAFDNLFCSEDCFKDYYRIVRKN